MNAMTELNETHLRYLEVHWSLEMKKLNTKNMGHANEPNLPLMKIAISNNIKI